MPKLGTLVCHFEDLVGSKAKKLRKESSEILLFEGKGLGYSQFNEVLLLLGYRRVSLEFFQFLVGKGYGNQEVYTLDSKDQLEAGVDRFTELALMFYGNIRFAYKELAQDSLKLKEKLLKSIPNDIKEFKKRHKVLREIEKIPADKTYFLGYLIENELKKKLLADPNNKDAKRQEKIRRKYVKIGERNQVAYLASDHMDVYIATSMREPHEYLFVNQTVDKIFNSKEASELNLRCFDPTQAYCKERVDKGLSEALMLKRAKCTIYLAQESETLGKDSELASTLAQGKVVIAYVPEVNKEFIDELLKNLKKLYKHKTEKELIMEQLRIFNSKLAWEKKKIRDWIDHIEETSILDMKKLLLETAKENYDKREVTLKSIHPLGIQVNLESGVANGVLVVRTIDDCIRLMCKIVLNDLDYAVDRDFFDDEEYIYLTEEISSSVFRLQSGNSLLTNTFWNFYNLDKQN